MGLEVNGCIINERIGTRGFFCGSATPKAIANCAYILPANWMPLYDSASGGFMDGFLQASMISIPFMPDVRPFHTA